MLREYRKSNPAFLAKPGDGKTSPLIVGDVFIDGTASVHPTAKVRNLEDFFFLNPTFRLDQMWLSVLV